MASPYIIRFIKIHNCKKTHYVSIYSKHGCDPCYIGYVIAKFLKEKWKNRKHYIGFGNIILQFINHLEIPHDGYFTECVITNEEEKDIDDFDIEYDIEYDQNKDIIKIYTRGTMYSERNFTIDEFYTWCSGSYLGWTAHKSEIFGVIKDIKEKLAQEEE